MASYDAIKDLPLEVSDCAFEGLELKMGEFERLTTVVKLRGAGEEGIGEGVVYDAVDHIGQQSHGPPDGLAHSGTFDEFSRKLDGIDLFPAGEPGGAAHPGAAPGGHDPPRRAGGRAEAAELRQLTAPRRLRPVGKVDDQTGR